MSSTSSCAEKLPPHLQQRRIRVREDDDMLLKDLVHKKPIRKKPRIRIRASVTKKPPPNVGRDNDEEDSDEEMEEEQILLAPNAKQDSSDDESDSLSITPESVLNTIQTTGSLPMPRDVVDHYWETNRSSLGDPITEWNIHTNLKHGPPRVREKLSKIEKIVAERNGRCKDELQLDLSHYAVDDSMYMTEYELRRIDGQVDPETLSVKIEEQSKKYAKAMVKSSILAHVAATQSVPTDCDPAKYNLGNKVWKSFKTGIDFPFCGSMAENFLLPITQYAVQELAPLAQEHGIGEASAQQAWRDSPGYDQVGLWDLAVTTAKKQVDKIVESVKKKAHFDVNAEAQYPWDLGDDDDSGDKSGADDSNHENNDKKERRVDDNDNPKDRPPEESDGKTSTQAPNSKQTTGKGQKPTASNSKQNHKNSGEPRKKPSTSQKPSGKQPTGKNQKPRASPWDSDSDNDRDDPMANVSNNQKPKASSSKQSGQKSGEPKKKSPTLLYPESSQHTKTTGGTRSYPRRKEKSREALEQQDYLRESEERKQAKIRVTQEKKQAKRKGKEQKPVNDSSNQFQYRSGLIEEY